MYFVNTLLLHLYINIGNKSSFRNDNTQSYSYNHETASRISVLYLTNTHITYADIIGKVRIRNRESYKVISDGVQFTFKKQLVFAIFYELQLSGYRKNTRYYNISDNIDT